MQHRRTPIVIVLCVILENTFNCLRSKTKSTNSIEQGDHMKKIPKSPLLKAKSLAQQKSDFTAEGAPAPGNVGTAPPATPEYDGKASSPLPNQRAKK
jgi:hypothetical protein